MKSLKMKSVIVFLALFLSAYTKAAMEGTWKVKSLEDRGRKNMLADMGLVAPEIVYTFLKLAEGTHHGMGLLKVTNQGIVSTIPLIYLERENLIGVGLGNPGAATSTSPIPAGADLSNPAMALLIGMLKPLAEMQTMALMQSWFTSFSGMKFTEDFTNTDIVGEFHSFQGGILKKENLILRLERVESL